VTELRWLLANFSPRRPEFDPRSGHMGSVVDKVAVEQIFSEYFGFPCQFSFQRLLHNHHHHHHLSSGAGTIGQIVADAEWTHYTPPQEKKSCEQPTRCGSPFWLCDVDLNTPQHKCCFRQIIWHFLSNGQITSGILFFGI
jgi:hypothetical protein